MVTESPSLPVGNESPRDLAMPQDAALGSRESLPTLGVLLLVVGSLFAFTLLVGRGPEPAGSLPAAVAALRGSWEGVGPADAPSRVEIEAVQPAWAVVHYNWRDHPIGQVQRGWVQVKAKVSPEGQLFWRNGGAFTFTLSADQTRLVGTRESGGKQARVELRRIVPVRLQAPPPGPR
jgi:hypothetical protein